jgi:pseudouridine kinase
MSHTSNPGNVTLSYGGVARNVCEVLVDKLGVRDALFISAIGNDQFGNLLKHDLGQTIKLDLAGIITGDNRTAVYNCIMDETGEMIAAIADMDIFEKDLTPQNVLSILKPKLQTKVDGLIFLDGNISVNVFQTIDEIVKQNPNYSVFFDPTSVPKSIKPIDANCLCQMTYIKPNEDELVFMAKHLQKKLGSKKNIENIDDCLDLLILQGGVKHILLTRGPKGVIYAKKGPKGVQKQYFKALDLPSHVPANVTGCGDSFCAGFIYGIIHGKTVEDSIVMGTRAAHMTLQSPFSVHPLLSVEHLLGIKQV